MSNLIALQHLVPSTLWLHSQIERSGRFSKLTMIGKEYSTIESVCQKIGAFRDLSDWGGGCFDRSQRLVFLDDGGGLYQGLVGSLANDVLGVEQTSFGLESNWACPVVAVCRSAAKLLFESQIIARGIRRKLISIGVIGSGQKVGIIGLGALGFALQAELDMLGEDVRVFDPKLVDPQVRREALSALLSWGDLFLGCAGADVLSGMDVSTLGARKIFASCSSREIEFRSVIAALPRSGIFSDIRGEIGRTECIVLNGGYPINFDRVREWEEFEEIVLTRRLCLAAISQAEDTAGAPPGSIMLDPLMQHNIVQEWLNQVPDSHLLKMPESLSARFFRDNSEGRYDMTDKPQYALHWTTPDAVGKMREHKTEYEVTVLGQPILVLPNVWSPGYDWSSLFYVENLVDVRDRSFLEIGSGTGVISVFAGRGGASRVVAVDVNPDAVQNTKRNFERFSVKNAEAFVSDGFAAIKGKFDVVTWNAPYHGAQPADELERGCTDEDYNDIKAFFRDVQKHLNLGGMVVFGFSESGDLPLIRRLIAESGLRIKRELSDWRQGYNCMLFDLVVDQTGNRTA
jgi:release factor glutamine methyltransferase